LRTFVALELKDQALKSRIGEIQQELLATGAQLKPVEPQNLHITLKFIGETPESSVDGIIKELDSVLVPPFSVHFRGLGVFPSSSRINVVWLGVKEGDNDLRALASKVNERLAKYGKPASFQAHLTIARVKGGRNLSALASHVMEHGEEEGGPVDFGEFQLKKSVLTPEGPIYSDLKVFLLR